MTVDELAEEVLIDVEATEETLQNLSDLCTIVGDRAPSVHECAAYGAYVRDAYTGLENILLRFAKFKSVPIPDTADWHSGLIAMFRDPPQSGLPLLLPDALLQGVQDYRGFRHVFNKRYSAHLDWRKLKPLVENAQTVFFAFHSRVREVLKEMGASGV
jgi:hypothetical protein